MSKFKSVSRGLTKPDSDEKKVLQRLNTVQRKYFDDPIRSPEPIDFANELVDRETLEQFEKQSTNGSRNTLLGALAGRTIRAGGGALVGYGAGESTADAGGFGALAGAGAGFISDRYAAQIFKALIDGSITTQQGVQSLSKPLGKFAKPLVNAASKGNKSLATTHYILSQQSPEYREMLKKQNQENEDE